MKNKTKLLKIIFMVTIVATISVMILLFLFSCSHEHTEQIIKGEPASCTKDGYTDKIVCTECNRTLSKSKVIKAKGHNEEIVPAKNVTCTEDGATEGKKCVSCGDYTVRPTVIPARHVEKIISAKQETCTENGNKQGIGCANCDYIFVEPEVILAHHTEEVIPKVEPDIGINGMSEGKKCIICKEVTVEPYEISLLSMEVKNSSVGTISGNLTLDKVEGEFSFYYADENKKRLDYYNALATLTVDAENNTVAMENLIIPSTCKYIIASNGEEYEYFTVIPTENTLSSVNYSFGALSDVHYNNGNYFNGALDFLDKCNVDLVGVSGDLTNNGEVRYFEKFNEAIKDRLYKVFTTSGNHDTAAIKNGDWQKYVNTSITTDKEVVNIGENGIDFVFIPNKTEDNVFVFLCQTNWSYPTSPSSKNYYIITEKQIEWLSTVLETYKEKNVFLFFHTFLSGPSGNQDDAVGNLVNPGGHYYNLPFSYGSGDEIAFRELMKKYKNVVYFSGHSHWMFELEIYNENLNCSNFDGEYCYMVHVPSVCTPRWIGEDDTSRVNKTGEASEGWIVEICDEAIVLIPVDFILQVFYTEYMVIIPLD